MEKRPDLKGPGPGTSGDNPTFNFEMTLTNQQIEI